MYALTLTKDGTSRRPLICYIPTIIFVPGFISINAVSKQMNTIEHKLKVCQ